MESAPFIGEENLMDISGIWARVNTRPNTPLLTYPTKHGES